jgi:predicted Holliday junction resolvase-like endonuclease
MLEWVLVFLGLALLLVLWLYRRAWNELNGLKFDRQSILTRHGKAMEQFIPFLNNYPYSKENFRFLGTPIDGVQFEDDRIVFVEFKTGDSRLTARQESIKKLVENGKVEFRELRVR